VPWPFNVKKLACGLLLKLLKRLPAPRCQQKHYRVSRVDRPQKVVMAVLAQAHR